MKKRYTIARLLFLLFTVCFLNGCTKDDDTSADPTDSFTNEAEALSSSEVTILDNMPEATSFSLTYTVLPNGETLDNYMRKNDSAFYSQWHRKSVIASDFKLMAVTDKNSLIAKISVLAFYLTERAFFQKPDEGLGKPAQNGLGYSWGSKNYNIRQKPPGKAPVCTNYQIYGLDCSGFIHQIFANAGISLRSGPADEQRKASIIQTAITSSYPGLNGIEVKDLGDSISPSKFETGDIIYWTDNAGIASHIGIVLKDLNGSLAVFQSNGDRGNNLNECTNNLTLKRGPRRILLNDPNWFGPAKKYGITRIIGPSCPPDSQFALLTGGSTKIWENVATPMCGNSKDTESFSTNYMWNESFWATDAMSQCKIISLTIQFRLCNGIIYRADSTGQIGNPRKIISLTTKQLVVQNSDGTISTFVHP